MAIWILKAVTQKAISLLPLKHRINHFFQAYVTKGVLLTDKLMSDKLTPCRSHLLAFKKYGTPTSNFTALELGTGWYPIIPIALYLSGAKQVYTIDISSLLKAKGVQQTIEKFEQFHQSGRLKDFVPDVDETRFKHLQSLKNLSTVKELLDALNITSIVGDARNINLPATQFDLICSNNTFEHIYPQILSDILKEFHRLLNPTGIMSHQIDMSDHFAHLDKSITVYNYLAFSDAQWNLIDNSIQPQNRLRITDYRELLKNTGFTIIEENNVAEEPNNLKKVKLADKFKKYSEADVAVTHTALVVKP